MTSWAGSLTPPEQVPAAVAPSLFQRQPGLRGQVPVVVDMDDRPPGSVEDGRTDGGAEAGGAVHPDLAGRHRAGAARHLPERDVHRSPQIARLPFVRTPDV